jgi:uncharacterized membrane protein HdeD (DUF308 family)
MLPDLGTRFIQREQLIQVPQCCVVSDPAQSARCHDNVRYIAATQLGETQVSGFTDFTYVSTNEISGARCACVAELRAVSAIVFGVAALCLSFLTFPWLMSLFVLFLFVDGALVILLGCLAAWHRERGAARALPGIVNLLVASALLLTPEMGIASLVTLLGSWAAVTGALGIGTACRGPGRKGRFILLTVGAISLGWGAMLCLTHEARQMALAWWLGIYCLCLGFMLLLLAPRLRTDCDQASSNRVDPVKLSILPIG